MSSGYLLLSGSALELDSPCAGYFPESDPSPNVKTINENLKKYSAVLYVTRPGAKAGQTHKVDDSPSLLSANVPTQDRG